MQVVAFSGGEDSSAMALRMAELGEDFCLLFNVVGNEFPELLDHVRRVAGQAGRKLSLTSAGYSLHERIRRYASTPNHRMRWCTRELKIEPTKAWLLAHPGATLCVGLRADEDREGAPALYGESVTYRLPLVEWGWSEDDVRAYLESRGVCVPERTDCPLCYDQRLGEWYKLWRDHPELFAEGEALEELTGHTFRSPTAGKFPNSLKGMRAAFEAGVTPRGIVSLPLFNDYDESGEASRRRCRVCSL